VGIERGFSAELADPTGGHGARLVAAAADAGVTLPGAVLINHALTDAPVNPEHALIYEVAAVD